VFVVVVVVFPKDLPKTAKIGGFIHDQQFKTKKQQFSQKKQCFFIKDLMDFFLCEQQGKLVILQGYSQESGT
jgi:hypothetical protein